MPRSLSAAITAANDRLLDVFGPGFDLGLYRALARNEFAAPGVLQSIRHLNQAPKVLLRTVNEVRRPIDPVTLDTAAAASINTAGIWSGQHFGLAAMERGTDTREGRLSLDHRKVGRILPLWETAANP